MEVLIFFTLARAAGILRQRIMLRHAVRQKNNSPENAIYRLIETIVRMHPSAKPAVLCLASACMLAHYSASSVAAYPDRIIRIVVPYAPGGGTDTVSRMLGQKLGEAVKQPVVIDFRPGNASIAGSQFVVKSAPDGYTVLFGSTSQALNVSLFSNMPYDPLKDLAPVTLLCTAPQILVVNPMVTARTVKELIALAKAGPDKLTFASSGVASINQLAGELFKSAANVKMVHVPYKGGGQAVIDLLGGRVDMYFGSIPSVIRHVQAGKLRALATTGSIRSQSIPDVPTIAEAELPGYEMVGWYALSVPAVTPRDLIAKLNIEVLQILKMPDFAARLSLEGFDAVGSSPQELDTFLRAEITKNARIVQSANIRPE